MPANIHINDDSSFTSLHIDGTVNSQALLDLMENTLQDSQFKNDWPQLVDLRQASIDCTKDELQDLLQQAYKRYRPYIEAPMAIAIQASTEPDILATAYRFVCNMPDTEIFDDYAQALTWLIAKTEIPSEYLLQHPNSHTQNPDNYPENKRA
ncbi:MAG: hypothetical protein KUG75_01435 [Pseudomonadales bacterium]|nr:hypothetical protein [Pseudomonadales bacterium]